MNYYKITNRDELHGNMQYRDGLNINVEPFNPKGDCTNGGIYFAREDILAFLDCGIWLRKVTLPENPEVYENPGRPKKWKTHRVILNSRVRITHETIKKLISEGAKVKVTNNFPLRWAITNNQTEIIKVLFPLSDLDTRLEGKKEMLWKIAAGKYKLKDLNKMILEEFSP